MLLKLGSNIDNQKLTAALYIWIIYVLQYNIRASIVKYPNPQAHCHTTHTTRTHLDIIIFILHFNWIDIPCIWAVVSGVLRFSESYLCVSACIRTVWRKCMPGIFWIGAYVCGLSEANRRICLCECAYVASIMFIASIACRRRQCQRRM